MQTGRILLVVAIVVAGACAAPFVRHSKHAVNTRRYSSGYSSGYNSGYSSGYSSGSSSASSTTSTSVTLTQKVTLALTSSQYTGNVKTVMETAYGIVLGIYSTTSTAWETGCSVASAVSTRRAIVVEYTATVSQTKAAAANTNAKAMTASSLTTAASQAKTALGAAYSSVSVPTVSNVQTPTCTGSNCGTASGVSSTSVSMFTLVAAMAMGLMLRQ